jgi:integrase
MARPRRDGTPPREPNRRKLTDAYVTALRPEPGRLVTAWDTRQRGLAVTVQSSGSKAWKAVYHFHGRPRWYHIGDAGAIGLADARKLAGRVMFQVAEGKDPAAERQAARMAGTFEELATRYRDEHAKKRNRSWKQADAIVRKYLLPKWAKLRAADIKRSDVKTVFNSIAAPIAANQVLAAASAIFSWAMREEIGQVTVNPCTLVERNDTKSRERVLSDSEVPLFWKAFDDAGLVRSTALKLILLTGQRPGEVRRMRREHIIDGWWELPGVPKIGWLGTKSDASHRVWLPAPARALLDELANGTRTGLVFPGAPKLDGDMRAICAKLGVNEKVTPHDLRRTHGTRITGLGFGRDAMNRVQNHKEGGIATVYDRHQYAEENKKIMETVAAHIMALITGTPAGNVVVGSFSR